MKLTVAPFDAVEAAAGKLSEFHEVFRESSRLEKPEDRDPTYDGAIGRLRTPLTVLGTTLR